MSNLISRVCRKRVSPCWTAIHFHVQSTSCCRKSPDRNRVVASRQLDQLDYRGRAYPAFLLTIIVAFMMGLAIYGPAIRLPLYLDDAPQFRWLAPLNVAQIWYTFQI